MRISDWSSDVCSSDLRRAGQAGARVAAHGYRAGRQGDRMKLRHGLYPRFLLLAAGVLVVVAAVVGVMLHRQATMQRDVVALSQESIRSEEHTSELQSLMRISYAVFSLNKKKPAYRHNK